jgi:hypothetical protein
MFWYVVISLMVLLGIAAWVVYGPEHEWITKQWAWFLYFTIALFVLLVKMYWKVRKPRKFWALLLLLFVLHVLAYAPFLKYIPRGFLYLLIIPLEAMLIFLIIKLVLNIMPDPKPRI